jgi:excisionase family DNA binding protein
MTDNNNEYLTTAELGELLRIKDRKVYELASSGAIPCTRATGKLLFPRREIDAWLMQKGNHLKPQASAEPRPAVFLGSHDPLLDWALKESGCQLASNFNGSLDGLERFAAGEGIAASMHLYEAEREDWNQATVAQRFSDEPVVLVEFCWRQRGLVIREDSMDAIREIEDLRGRRIAPRQASAGSQVLLLQLLEQQGIDPEAIDFCDTAYTETDAVTAVLQGNADATLGLASIARQFNLAFVPLVCERFDLLVDRRGWFEPPFQAFLAFCNSTSFRERAESLDGYDVSGFGKVRFNG